MSNLADSYEQTGTTGLGYKARVLTHVAIFVALIAVWELLGVAGRLNTRILPPPSSILREAFELYFVTGIIWWHLFVTAFETVAGFVIGSSIGIGLAILAAVFPAFRKYFAPYVVIIQVTPMIAIAPMMIAWFGFGWSSKIAIAALICFFPPFVNSLAGLSSLDPDSEELFKSIRANRFQLFWKLRIPNSVPLVVAGCKTGIALALIGAVVGEFISASEGLGILLQRSAFTLNIAESLAVLISLSLLGMLLYFLIDWLGERIVYWQSDRAMARVGKRRRAKWLQS